jgi:hypothetical protein
VPRILKTVEQHVRVNLPRLKNYVKTKGVRTTRDTVPPVAPLCCSVCLLPTGLALFFSDMKKAGTFVPAHWVVPRISSSGSLAP